MQATALWSSSTIRRQSRIENPALQAVLMALVVLSVKIGLLVPSSQFQPKLRTPISVPPGKRIFPARDKKAKPDPECISCFAETA